MSNWLRRLFVVLTIGGGFLGLVMGVPMLISAGASDSNRLIQAVVFGLVYLYAIYLGLRLSNGNKPIWGLVVYFGLQVPWIDCPSFSYRFYSGVMVGWVFAADGQRGIAAVGFLQQISILPGLPLSFGLNVIALLIVFVLFVVSFILEDATERSNQALEPTADRTDV